MFRIPFSTLSLRNFPGLHRKLWEGCEQCCQRRLLRWLTQKPPYLTLRTSLPSISSRTKLKKRSSFFSFLPFAKWGKCHWYVMRDQLRTIVAANVRTRALYYTCSSFADFLCLCALALNTSKKVRRLAFFLFPNTISSFPLSHAPVRKISGSTHPVPFCVNRRPFPYVRFEQTAPMCLLHRKCMGNGEEKICSHLFNLHLDMMPSPSLRIYKGICSFLLPVQYSNAGTVRTAPPPRQRLCKQLPSLCLIQLTKKNCSSGDSEMARASYPGAN